MSLACMSAMMAALAAGPAPGRLTVTGAPVPPLGEYGMLAIEVRAPWMQGHLTLRMPETLASAMGLHFIDHRRSDMPPLSMLDPVPQWKPAKGGGVGYSARTREGVVFEAQATPRGDTVELLFRVRNETGKPMQRVNSQMCLVLNQAPAFAGRNDLSPLRAWIDGRFTSLSETTPTPAQKGRDAWVLMLTRPHPERYAGPRDYADGWWVVDQVADEPVLARVSTDAKHLVAIQWDQSPAMLMSNTRIPCLHAGPTNAPDIAPGAERVWRGRIQLGTNDPAALLRNVRRFAGSKSRNPARPR